MDGTAAFAASLAEELMDCRGADGGFGMSRYAVSEVEPTAVAALALDDRQARDWISSAQQSDGGFAALDGRPESPSVAALAALVLENPTAASRALAHAVHERAHTVGESGDGDKDGVEGWGWTNDTYSWVEPTSRVLLATKILRPRDEGIRSEAVALLRDRRCPDGGWNYGNASVNGVDLRGYAQTTAVALIALQNEDATLVGPPLRFLENRWRNEPGGLTLSQTAVALQLHAVASSVQVTAAIQAVHRKTGFLGNVLALAWATLATGSPERLERLRSGA